MAFWLARADPFETAPNAVMSNIGPLGAGKAWMPLPVAILIAVGGLAGVDWAGAKAVVARKKQENKVGNGSDTVFSRSKI